MPLTALGICVQLNEVLISKVTMVPNSSLSTLHSMIFLISMLRLILKGFVIKLSQRRGLLVQRC